MERHEKNDACGELEGARRSMDGKGVYLAHLGHGEVDGDEPAATRSTSEPRREL